MNALEIEWWRKRILVESRTVVKYEIKIWLKIKVLNVNLRWRLY